MDFFARLFLSNWDRKLTALLLAISLWLIVSKSMTTIETLDNVPVRLINIPAGMTAKGLLSSGVLSERISLSLQGNKSLIKDLTANDLEVVLDATDKSDEWLAAISRKNLISLNPDIDLAKTVKRVVVQRLPISFTRMITEKIPVNITDPIGEAPSGYQYLDVWPYYLSVTVSGPVEKINEFKTKGIDLTFDLSKLTREDLEKAESASNEISYLVPDECKQVVLPTLSDLPLMIDDPQARDLRVDFIKSGLHPLTKPIPVALFFPAGQNMNLNPETFSIALGGLIDQVRGIYMIKEPLFAKGASSLFVEVVQDMLQISIFVEPTENKLNWSIQFQNPRGLEDRYVSIIMSDSERTHENPGLLKQREEYLRTRFRYYMNRFQLYKSETEKLDLAIEIDQNLVHIKDISHENISPR